MYGIYMERLGLMKLFIHDPVKPLKVKVTEACKEILKRSLRIIQQKVMRFFS